MEITEEEISEGKMITLSGHLNNVTAVEVQKKIINYIRSGTKTLFLDFSKVDYFSSAGLRALILISKCAKEFSAFVCLVSPSKFVEETLELTGSLAFIPIYKDLPTAIQMSQV